MGADGVVKALRERAAAANKRGYSGEASEWLELAELIESLQAGNAAMKLEWREAHDELRRMRTQVAREGFDDLATMIAKYKTVMLAANEISIEQDEEREELRAQLAASQRRESAAVEDLKLIVDAVRETHGDETCCFACAFDCDTSINDSGVPNCECPGFERYDCFEWRGVGGEDGDGE